MQRRSFLGLMGGAAVAGPSLANDITAGGEVNFPTRGSSSVGGLINQGGGLNYRLERVAELKRRISGDNPEKAEERQQNRLDALVHVERSRLDGLRSVSPSQKRRMLINYQEAVSYRRERYWWQKELDELLGGNDE